MFNNQPSSVGIISHRTSIIQEPLSRILEMPLFRPLGGIYVHQTFQQRWCSSPDVLICHVVYSCRSHYFGGCGLLSLGISAVRHPFAVFFSLYRKYSQHTALVSALSSHAHPRNATSPHRLKMHPPHSHIQFICLTPRISSVSFLPPTTSRPRQSSLMPPLLFPTLRLYVNSSSWIFFFNLLSLHPAFILLSPSHVVS